MKRKIISIGIISMFILTSFTVLSVINVKASGNIIIVDQEGNGDYTTIQDAINNAEREDLIIVRPGVYYENIRISQGFGQSPIEFKIIGESAGNTIIDGGGSGNTVELLSGESGYGIIGIYNFTIRNSGSDYAGIYISSHENTIKNNIIENNGMGIQIIGSRTAAMMNTVKDNVIQNNNIGAKVGSMSNIVYHNNFINNAIQAEGSINTGWNQPYPTGGNYWNDYLDEDLYKGSGQNEDGSDGIWDHAYRIGSSEDMYPYVDINGWLNNLPPNRPETPDGPVEAKTGDQCTYTTSATDPDRDEITTYEWDFTGNDYIVDETTSEPSVTKIWDEEGTYLVRVRAIDEKGAKSFWSEPLSVTMPKTRIKAFNLPILNFLEKSDISLISLIYIKFYQHSNKIISFFYFSNYLFFSLNKTSV